MKTAEIQATEPKYRTLLDDLIDVLTQDNINHGKSEEEAHTQATRSVMAMAKYFGGKSIYLPTGTILKTAMRDVEIYRAFNGQNIEELIKKYNLSESHIYSILRKQRAKGRKERDENERASRR